MPFGYVFSFNLFQGKFQGHNSRIQKLLWARQRIYSGFPRYVESSLQNKVSLYFENYFTLIGLKIEVQNRGY